MKDIGSRWWPTTRSLRNRDAIGGALPCPVEDSAPQGHCSPGGEVDVIGGRAPLRPGLPPAALGWSVGLRRAIDEQPPLSGTRSSRFPGGGGVMLK